jgi:hypothetical protein
MEYRVLVGRDCINVDSSAKRGVYLARSGDYYRAGAAGLSGTPKSYLLSRRLSLHASRSSPGNWTTQNRPWRPIWILEIREGSGAMVKALEHLLFGLMAMEFEHVETSGFRAPDTDEAALALLEAHQSDFEQIVRVQSS